MNNYKGFLVVSIALLASAPSLYAVRPQRKQAPEPCHMRLRSASASVDNDARNERAALPVIRYLTEVCRALEAAEAAAKQARQEAAAERARMAAEQREQRSENTSFNDAEIRKQALAYLAGERDDLGDESEQDVLRVASPTSEDATHLASWYDYTQRRTR